MNSHLVTEDLDLRVGPVQRLVAAVVVAVRVDLDHQRKTLDPLLRGEVCTQTVDRDEDLPSTQTRIWLRLKRLWIWMPWQFSSEEQPEILTSTNRASSLNPLFLYQALKKTCCISIQGSILYTFIFHMLHPPPQRHGLNSKRLQWEPWIIQRQRLSPEAVVSCLLTAVRNTNKIPFGRGFRYL